MDVDGRRLPGKRLELRPRPAPWGIDVAVDPQIPLIEMDARRGTGRQDRKVRGCVLTGREPTRQRRIATATAKRARDESPHHRDCLLPRSSKRINILAYGSRRRANVTISARIRRRGAETSLCLFGSPP